MKKIAKILIITIISILFINNAKADTTITTQTFPVIEAYMQETGKTIEDFRDIVMQNIEKPADFDDYEHYVVIIERGGGSTNSFHADFILSDTFNFALLGTNLWLRDGPYETQHSIRYSTHNYGYVFNSDYTELTYDSTWTSSPGIQFNLYNPLTSLIISSDLDEINYEVPSWSTDTLSINNLLYPFGSYIPLSDLNYYNLDVIDYYSLPPQPTRPICNATQVVGMFENPSEFDITISGTGNALKENIEGLLTITYEANTTYSASDWEIIDTTSELTTGNYNFTCDNEYSKCELTYSYNYEDDIDETISMNFKFKTIQNVDMPSFIRLYNCSKDYENINITYNYTKKTTQEDTTNNKLDNIVGGIGNLLNLLNPSNLIYIVVPTEKQMQSLLNEMQDSINSKLGILGLPLTIYTRFMNLANTSTQENWCITWNSIKVPNFENSEIIPAGEWCYNTILENQTINNFRNVSMGIIGGLILLSFIQYLNNVYHRVIDSPDRDEYIYITTEDIYDINDNTGEVSNHKLVQKKTRREKQ